MQPLHSGSISIPGAPKPWTWKLPLMLAPKIAEKSQKCAQSGSQETPNMTLKSVKMHTWTSKCLLGGPLDHRITKMVSQVPNVVCCMLYVVCCMLYVIYTNLGCNSEGTRCMAAIVPGLPLPPTDLSICWTLRSLTHHKIHNAPEIQGHEEHM